MFKHRSLSFFFMSLVSVAASLPALGGSEIKVVGALGDSLTAAFNARSLGDNRDLSWSTGSSPDINSHFRRLSVTRSGLTAYNESIAGSVASDLNRQITRLMRRNPDYATITIGANDVCSWGADYQASLQTFTTTLRAALQRIVTERSSIKIYVAPIPDLYNLWEIASPRAQCRNIWNIVGVCSPLLGSSATDADRLAFVERWRAANDAIATVAAEFPGQVLHDPSVRDTKFEWNHVSPIDCFHPSVEGQNFLSELSWQAVGLE